MRRELNSLTDALRAKAPYYHSIWETEKSKKEGVHSFLKMANAPEKLISFIVKESTFKKYFGYILSELTSEEEEDFD